MATQTRQPDQAVAPSLAFLQALLSGYHPRDFAVLFWDGSQWPAEIDPPRFMLALKHPGAVQRMFQDPGSDLSLGEAIGA